MKCPVCGTGEVGEVLRCASCGHELEANRDTSKVDLVRRSEMAVWSMNCAIAGPVFSILLGILGGASGVTYGPAAGVLAGLALSAVGLLLGSVSLIRIGLSGGRLTGRGFAVIGITIPLIELSFIFLLATDERMRGISTHITCATNLSGIGKALIIYANDYDDTLPLAGGANGRWVARTPWWAALDRRNAYGLSDPNAPDGRTGVSANLSLLVKYGEVPLESFVCKGDSGTKEFKPADYGLADRKPADLWDFGPEAPLHCSYAYHMSYGPYPATVFRRPDFAVAADRNPWIDAPFAKSQDFSLFRPDMAPYNGTARQGRRGNAVAHKGDGQNVLFLDSHVEFMERSFVGIDSDNIYTYGSGPNKAWGTPPVLGSQPAAVDDSMLVNDPAIPRP